MTFSTISTYSVDVEKTLTVAVTCGPTRRLVLAETKKTVSFQFHFVVRTVLMTSPLSVTWNFEKRMQHKCTSQQTLPTFGRSSRWLSVARVCQTQIAIQDPAIESRYTYASGLSNCATSNAIPWPSIQQRFSYLDKRYATLSPPTSCTGQIHTTQFYVLYWTDYLRLCSRFTALYKFCFTTTIIIIIIIIIISPQSTHQTQVCTDSLRLMEIVA